MALIDIAIPNYCYGRYLEECVASIRVQGVDDIRILIVDNASTDDSVAVARRLMKHDKRITLVARDKNLGHHASYNEGVDWAASKYFMLLCADDLLVEGCFARALTVLEQESDVSLACGAELVWHTTNPPPAIENRPDEPWRLLSSEAFTLERSLPSKVLFGGGAALVRTADLKRVGHFRTDVAFNEDLELYLRLSLNRRVAVTNAVHGIRRVHGANISAIFWRDFKRDLVETRQTFDSFFTRDAAAEPGVGGLRRRVYGNLGKRAYWSAISHIVRGQRAAGLELFKLAFELSPRLAVLPPLDYLMRMGDPMAHMRMRLAEALGRHTP